MAGNPILPLAKDYTQSTTPQFDAVEDVKAYFGRGWAGIYSVIYLHSADLGDFIRTCQALGITDGYQIGAIWDLIKGGGKFLKARRDLHNGLRQAFLGVHEDELGRQWDDIGSYEVDWVLADKVHWIDLQSETLALGATPKYRLETYLEWNGILGFTETIWAIAQGDG